MTTTCKHHGCDRESREKGYCWGHAWRKRHGKPMDLPFERTIGRYAPDATCKVEGCNGRVRSLGYCHKHYGRVRAHGTPHHERFLRPITYCACGKKISHKSVRCLKCYLKLRRHSTRTTKTCIACGKAKARAEFYSKGRKANNRTKSNSACKACELVSKKLAYIARAKLAEALLIKSITGRLPLRGVDARFLKRVSRFKESNEWQNAKDRLRAVKRLLKDRDRLQSLVQASGQVRSSRS